MTIYVLISIIVWVIAAIIIAALLIFSRIHKNGKKRNAEKAYEDIKPERKPKPTKAVTQPVAPVEEEKKVEDPEPITEEIESQDEADEQDDDFEEEEAPERVVQVVNGRKVFVQFNYSFKAKLILASKEVQEQYRALVNYARSYGAKTSISWKQERIYLGRNTYAMLLFKGKKLCVSYALDPQDYLESKYRIIDLSEVKRFEKTKTLLKITSDRKFKYSFELLDIVFAQNNLVKSDSYVEEKIDIPSLTKDELIDEKLIKVYTSEEVTEGAIIEQVNVADIIQKNVTIQEAKKLLTDDSALEYLQVEEGTKNKVYTKRDIINIDTLSKAFEPNELVNLETLKEKKLISAKTDYIKVLARGVLDKALVIEAQDFSIDAIKMIVVTGGEVRKVN